MKQNPKPLRRLEDTVTKGNLWLYVLSILKKKDAYAYGLRDLVDEKFGWRPGLITSYMVLYKLEAEGLITSKFEGRRKYYSITKKGVKTLDSGKKILKKVEKKL